MRNVLIYAFAAAFLASLIPALATMPDPESVSLPNAVEESLTRLASN